MKKFNIYVYIITAIILIDIVGVLIGVYFPALQANLTKKQNLNSPLPLGEGQGVRASSGQNNITNDKPKNSNPQSPISNPSSFSPHPNPLPKGEGTNIEKTTQPPKKVDVEKIRIVSLSPSTTEMLFVLDAGESIVGATEYCDFPPAAKRIERIGGFGRPSLEKLLALAPDLVVAAGLERGDSLQALRKSGIRAIDVNVKSIDGMFQALRQIGDAVDKRQRAEEVVAAMRAELENIAAQSNDGRRGPPLRVFVELWDDPLTTIGGSSFLDDVISRAGGVNVAHELPQPHLRISPEKVIQWDPDVIVVAHMKRSAGSPAQIADRIGWSDMTAVKRGRVICDIPHDLILRPGPRLIEGVKTLAQRLRAVDSNNNNRPPE